jgi:hypothetical protein
LCSKIKQIFISHNRYTNTVPNLTYFRIWIYLTLFVNIVSLIMKYEDIENTLFIEMRIKLRKLLNNNSLAIFQSHRIFSRSQDNDAPLRHYADPAYLSGIDQEMTILLIYPNCPKLLYREVLFLRQMNKHIRTWLCHKYTKISVVPFIRQLRDTKSHPAMQLIRKVEDISGEAILSFVQQA